MNQNTQTKNHDLRQLVEKIIAKISSLKMLVLFDSRVVGNIHSKSDRDFAVIYDSGQLNQNRKENELLQTLQIISEVLEVNEDLVDVIDLEQSTPLLAHFIARDGELIYEQRPGEFEQFKQKALLNDIELQTVENNLKEQINTFLKEWAEK